MTQSERREKFAQTHQAATEIIGMQRAARDAKTARLRAERLAVEAGSVVASPAPLLPAKGNI